MRARALFPVMILLLPGCAAREGPEAQGQEAGGCTTRVEHDGRTYRSHNEIDQQLPRARSLGAGRAVDCEGQVVDGSLPLEIRAVRGVDPDVAIAVAGRSELSGVYVEVGLVDRDGLPAALRDRDR